LLVAVTLVAHGCCEVTFGLMIHVLQLHLLLHQTVKRGETAMTRARNLLSSTASLHPLVQHPESPHVMPLATRHVLRELHGLTLPPASQVSTNSANDAADSPPHHPLLASSSPSDDQTPSPPLPRPSVAFDLLSQEEPPLPRPSVAFDLLSQDEELISVDDSGSGDDITTPMMM
jgi:hypothetical protein